MKRRFPLTILSLTATFALFAVAASAQTPVAGAIPDIADLDGIEAAVSRTWSLDFEAMLVATPDLEPDDLGAGVIALSAMVLRFENEEQASAGYEAFLENIDADLLDLAQNGEAIVTDEQIDDLGDVASAVVLNTRNVDQETFFRFVLVHDGEYFFLTSALGDTSEHVTTADELARYLVEEGEKQGEEAVFVAEGASSGGLWGFMPDDDNVLLGELIPIFDETLFPAP